MKRTVLPILALALPIGLAAQKPASAVAGIPIKADRALAKAVTDTLPPGPWYHDPNTLFNTYVLNSNYGYMVGTNVFFDMARAQAFELSGTDPSALVEGVLFWFFVKGGNPNAVVHARLYACDGPGFTSAGAVNHAPGTVLANKDVPLAGVNASTDPYTFTTVMFDSPVPVQNGFAAGFDLTSLNFSTDTLALMASDRGIVGTSERSWDKWGSDATWHSFLTSWSGTPPDIDLCIFALMDNSSVGIDGPGALNGMRMSFLDGNISTGTVRLGYDVSEPGHMALTVHDMRGGVAHTADLGTQGAGRYVHAFGTDGWAAGSYIVTLTNNGRPLTKRMVVH